MIAAPTTAALELSELSALARRPIADPVSPFAEVPYVLVRLGQTAAGPSEDDDAAMSRWLRRQPCPVIAIADAGAHESLQRAFDVVVTEGTDLGALLANIRHAPLAAMTLVQVLRATEHLAIEQALVVESLAYSTLQGGPELRRWLAQRAPARGPRIPDAGPPVTLERNAARIAIRFNRPSRRNALSVELRDALCEALQLVVADPTIVTAELSGIGKCFSSGGDLDEFGTAPDPATAHAVRSLQLPARVLVQCADRVEFRLHGACVGAGAELPAFGRHVRARRDTWFELPEIRFGLIPGAGGCVSLPRRIGRQRTAFMGLSAARIDAAQALAWGLVDAVAD